MGPGATTARFSLGPAGFAALVGVVLTGCVPAGVETDRARFHLQQAELYLQQELPDSALAAFGLALEVNPRLVEAHVGMGRLYDQRGDYALAARSFERAVELAPQSFEANYFLGVARQMLGKWAEAIDSYLRALTLDPDSYEANNRLAGVYLLLGRPGDALAYAKRAAEHSASDQGAWSNLGACHALLGRPQEAAAAYRMAVEMSDPRPEILLAYADTLLKLSRYKDAVEQLQALARLKASALGYERLGYAQFKLSRFDDALASYRAALSFDPADTSSLNGLGVCLMTIYLQSHRASPSLRDEALAAWRKSLSVKPEQPRIVDLLNRYQRV